MSTAIRWRIILTVLIILIAGGTALTVLLALGLADPPRIGTLQWQAAAPDDWPEHTDTTGVRRLDAPVELPEVFTLELTVRNAGPPDSAWGLQLHNGESALTILIDNLGYWSLSTDDRPHWAEFMHLRPGKSNQIALTITPNSSAILRINEEIAWAGSLRATAWQVVLAGEPQLTWERLALYYSPE
ncbi:MAG: hypothetical protein K8J31_08090 [Anaerolineae bacterium]|nr:hypothetical protein [Anaerolineae bacterium]